MKREKMKKKRRMRRDSKTERRKEIGRTIGTKQEQNEEKVMVRQVSETEKW